MRALQACISYRRAGLTDVQLLQVCISYRRASLTGVYLLGVHLTGMLLIGVRLRAFQIWILVLVACDGVL